MEFQVVHKTNENRFEIKVGEETAYVEYTLHNDKLDIEHTFVPKAWEGQGLASILVKEAYGYALENQLKPEATCSYAIAWLERHPDYKR